MKQFKGLRWIIWGLAVFFYFYEYFIRVMPSVASDQMMRSFDLTAAGFGALSASYMYAYAPMQLPVGILMDKYGSRKLLTYASFLCGFGSILFGYTDSIYLAYVGRFFTGVGSSFGFVGMLYVCNHWFPKSNVAFLMGLGNALGMLGAIVGQGPLSFVIETVGWRDTNIIIGLIGLVHGVFVYLITRNESEDVKEAEDREDFTTVLSNFKSVLTNPQTYIIAFFSLCAYAPVATFGGLWAVPFFQDVYNLNPNIAAFSGSVLFLGFMIGGPLIGRLSDTMHRRKPFYLVSALAMLPAFALLLYGLPQNLYVAFGLVFIVGMACSVQLLTYSSAIEVNDIQAKGSSISVTNFIVFIGASITQPLIGSILDSEKTGSTLSPANYQVALSVITVCIALYLITLFFFKEDHKCDVSGVNWS